MRNDPPKVSQIFNTLKVTYGLIKTWAVRHYGEDWVDGYLHATSTILEELDELEPITAVPRAILALEYKRNTLQESETFLKGFDDAVGILRRKYDYLVEIMFDEMILRPSEMDIN